jgi:hypothetical protein
MTEAKWWIDHREVADADLLASIPKGAKVSVTSHEVH